MPIKLTPGGTMITGDGIPFFRMAALLTGLRFEIKTGMRIHRGPKCSTIIRRDYGLKGSPAKLLEQFEELVADASSKIERKDER
jgi:hypothetical protein